MFSNIKVGDFVIADTWSGSPSKMHKYKVCKVTKVNKRTFKLDEYPTKIFTKDHGMVYGGNGWGQIQLLEYNAEFYEKKILEVQQEELRINLIGKVTKINYNSLTTDQLERIIKIAEENKLQNVE